MKVPQCKIFLMFLSMLLLSGCEKDLDKYYERPNWLRGNAYEVMLGRGNFKLYLQAAEMTGFKDLLAGKGLCTVFAPDDEAFTAYLKANNYSSLEAIPLDKLKVLVGYHIIEQSWSEKYLLGFKVNPAGDAIDETSGDGTNYKYKSYAKEKPTLMVNPATMEEVSVYNREKYLPVISSRLFNAKKCADPEKTYKYFFPNVNWQGSDEKLYVCNAAMKEVGIATDNGYLYVLDKVVEPLRSIYKALEDSGYSDFSDYKSMFDRFANIVYDQTISTKYGQPGDLLYLYWYHKASVNTTDLPEIASEWSYHGAFDGLRPAYFMYGTSSYTCFAPTNQAFDQFISTFFEGNLQKASDIPILTAYYLLRAHARDYWISGDVSTILLPDQIDRGVSGEYGEKWPITTSNVGKREFCGNGLLYGIDQVLIPGCFQTITAPLFKDPVYSIMAYMFQHIDMYPQVIEPLADKYTLFIYSDTTLVNKYGMSMTPGVINTIGDEVVQQKRGATIATLNSDYKTYFAQSNTVYGGIRDFNKRAFYSTMSPFTYVYTKEFDPANTEGRAAGDLVIYGENGIFQKVVKSWDTNNGLTYELSDTLMKNSTTLVQHIQSSYSDFYAKLNQAGMLVTTSGVTSIQIVKTVNGVTIKEVLAGKTMVFAPKNGTLTNAPTVQADLALYLSYFFVSAEANKLTEYILPNYGPQGEFKTLQRDNTASTPSKEALQPIWITRVDEKKVALINKNNTRLETDGNIPFFAKDGLVYGINGVIQPNN